MSELLKRPPGRPPKVHLTPPPVAEEEPPEYFPMESAPHDRPILLSPWGIQAIWRVTRHRRGGAWIQVGFWADWLTQRRLGFDPTGWKERL
jgi:hypothetical protein